MAVHIWLLIYVSVLGAFIYRKKPTIKQNTIFVVLSFIPIFLIQTLRNRTIGKDTASYYNIFRMVATDTSYYERMLIRWEPIYIVLNRWIGQLSTSPQMLFGVCSFIVDFGVAYFIINNIKDRSSAFFAVFFWVCLSTYLNSMNTIRQSMTMSFTMNIYTVLNKEKSKKSISISICLIAIAVMLHASSLICILFFVPHFMKKMNRRRIILSVFIFIAVFMSFSYFFELMLRLFPQYARYIGTDYFEGNDSIGGYYVVLSAFKLILIGLTFLLYEKDQNANELYWFAWFSIVTIVLYVFKTKIAIASRVVYYFEIFMILYIPLLLQKLKYKRFSFFMIIGLYLIGWILYYHLLSGGFHGSRGCVPYYFFWQ